MVPPLKGSIRRVTAVNTSRPIGRSEAYAERDARTVALDRGATEFVIQAGVGQADGYFLQKVIRLQHKAGRVVKFESSARESATRQLRAQVIGQASAEAKLGQAVKDAHLERKPGPIDAAVGRVYACELVRQRNLGLDVLRIREDRDATAKINSFVG